MKFFALLSALVLSSSIFAKDLPNVTCIGSLSQAGKVEHVELTFRDGAAAFNDVYLGEINKVAFIVIINVMLPIKDTEVLPVTMGIYNPESGKAYIEAPAVFFPTGISKIFYAQTESSGLARLTCTRKLSLF